MFDRSLYATELKKEYETLRFQNHQLQNDHIREVREAIPRIAEIDDMIRDLTIDAALNHDNPVDKTQLVDQTQSLIKEKHALLTAAGYPADYLSPIYTCKKCRDTGYIGNDPCECLKQRFIARQYAQSNLGQKLDTENFRTFRLDYYSNQPDGIHELTPRENIENIYHSLQTYISDFPAYLQGSTSGKGNILFYGMTGVGKSFFSSCVAKELLDMGYAVLYTSAGTMFEQIGDVVMNKYQLPGSQDFYQAVTNCNVLIIDDLGTEMSNNFTNTYLYTLMNDRLLRRKATIISTNLSLTGLQNRYSERISSRIFDSYLIYLIYGEDIRLLRRKSWQTTT